jgi:hypothetical protein
LRANLLAAILGSKRKRKNEKRKRLGLWRSSKKRRLRFRIGQLVGSNEVDARVMQAILIGVRKQGHECHVFLLVLGQWLPGKTHQLVHQIIRRKVVRVEPPSATPCPQSRLDIVGEANLSAGFHRSPREKGTPHCVDLMSRIDSRHEVTSCVLVEAHEVAGLQHVVVPEGIAPRASDMDGLVEFTTKQGGPGIELSPSPLGTDVTIVVEGHAREPERIRFIYQLLQILRGETAVMIVVEELQIAKGETSPDRALGSPVIRVDHLHKCEALVVGASVDKVSHEPEALDNHRHASSCAVYVGWHQCTQLNVLIDESVGRWDMSAFATLRFLK